jgi:hypothetical protein
LTNIDGIAGLAGLEELDVEGCESLTSVDGIAGLSSLQSLNVRGCPAPLAHLLPKLPAARKIRCSDLEPLCTSKRDECNRRFGDSFAPSSIVEIAIVASFSTREHWDYALACSRPQTDAYAREWWEYQRRSFAYAAPEDSDEDDEGLPVLRRFVTDGLWPALPTLWTAMPSRTVRKQYGIDSIDSIVTVNALQCDRTERLTSMGKSGMDTFVFLTAAARKAAAAAGHVVGKEQDDDELRMAFTGKSKWYGEEPLYGITGFGLRFRDGSHIVRSYDPRTEDDSVRAGTVVKSVLEQWLSGLEVPAAQRTKILRLLGSESLEERLEAVDELAGITSEVE